MSAIVRLKRMGTKKRPCYRIVVMDKQSARGGRAIDELGVYHPIETEDKQVVFNEEKASLWLSRGAEISDTVHSIFNKKGFLWKKT